MGQSPDSTSYNSDKQGVPFYQGNADFGALYPKPRIWCNKPIKLAKENDILISVRAPVGALNFSKEECCIGRGLASITLDSNDFLLEFIYWSLRTGVKELQNKSTGSTFKSINKKTLEEVRIPKVPLKEQKDIIRNLTLLTNILAKYKHEIVFLDELVKARFVEMFGDPRINEKKWKAGKIVDYFEVKGGKRIPKGMGYAERKTNHPYLRASDMKNATILDDDIHYIDEEVYKRIKRYTVNAHDIYLTNVGVNLGMAGVIPKQYDGANLTENAVKLVPKDKILLNGMFLSYYINSPGIQHYINERKMSVGVPKLAIFRIESMPLLLPPLELQNQFASFVEEVDKSRLRELLAIKQIKLLLNDSWLLFY